MGCRALALITSLIWILAALNGADAGRGEVKQQQQHRSAQAYVTLLYGDEFLLGVRVLGKSIRDTGTSKDLAVIVSQGVSPEAISLLQADGWIVLQSALLQNPNEIRPSRFWGVYTKLKIFNLTQYEKVVYLDADTIVVQSIEDLFQCQKFCANLKHSERLNSGVMVVEPSKELFEDMLKKIDTLPSYTGGDQGFLNSYYPDFPNAQLFNPDLSPAQRQPRLMERLSTLYNADVGLYMLANKWMVDGSKLRVVHYTLGPLKPWDWWTAWLLKPVDLWQNIRVRLESSLPGTGGGHTAHDRLVVGILFVLPLLVTGFMLWSRRFPSQCLRAVCNGSFCGCLRHALYRSTLPVYSSVGKGQQLLSGMLQYLGGSVSAVYIGVLSILTCFLLALLSLGLAFVLIPRQVMPWTGMLLLYEWTFFLFGVGFGKYLDFVYEWGKSSVSPSASLNYSQSKGHSKQNPSVLDMETNIYGFGMAALAVLVPCLPFMFGITALFLRLGVIVGAAMVLVAYLTYSAQHLGIRWFLRGREDCIPLDH